MSASERSRAAYKGHAPARPLEVLCLSPTPTWPLDFGNRKRVNATCQMFKELGHRITFVHYASENDWRAPLPLESMQRMAADWDAVHHVAPSRPLHASPTRGADHEPDEWWDPSLENFLVWLFERQRFDLFIVNYAWLSRALLLCPRQTFRVLDTHDRLGGRRAMLESQGIAPEFFHLTNAAEIECLNRAQMVWAIKDEEREYFAGVVNAAVPVVTVPHWENAVPSKARAKLEREVIRLGILGARNNINKSNVRKFLSQALPIFTASLAPLKVVLGGSMCEDMTDIEHPLVEKMGFVENIDEFYNDCDAVVVPMFNSSGQKIRVGESLARSKPILSSAHAFEGYPSAHPYHKCKTVDELITACLDLSFSPKKMQALQVASQTVQTDLEKRFRASIQCVVDAALDYSSGITLIVPSEVGAERSLVWERLIAIVQFTKWFGAVSCWYDGAMNGIAARRLTELSRLTSLALGENARRSLAEMRQLPLKSWAASLEATIDASRGRVVWCGSEDAERYDEAISKCGQIHFDLLLSSRDGSHHRLSSNPSVAATIIGNSRGAIEAVTVERPNVRTLVMPLLYRSLPRSLEAAWNDESDDVFCLTSSRTRSLFESIAPLIVSFLKPGARLLCVGADEGMYGEAVVFRTQSEIVEDWKKLGKRPFAAVILDGEAGTTSVVDELLRRFDVPTIRPTIGGQRAGAISGKGSLYSPRTIQQLFLAIETLMQMDAGQASALFSLRWGNDYTRDVGWSTLWRTLEDRRVAGRTFAGSSTLWE